jgi:hypothetical protein
MILDAGYNRCSSSYLKDGGRLEHEFVSCIIVYILLDNVIVET